MRRLRGRELRARHYAEPSLSSGINHFNTINLSSKHRTQSLSQVPVLSRICLYYTANETRILSKRNDPVAKQMLQQYNLSL